MIRTVAIVIFPDFQLLDAAGPVAAFELAGTRSRAGSLSHPRLGRRRRIRWRARRGSGLTAEPLGSPAGSTRCWSPAGSEPTSRAASRRCCLAARGCRRCPAGCERLHRRVLWQQPACSTAGAPRRIGAMPRAGAAISGDPGRARPHLRARRQDLDVGRDYRRHRPGAGADRRRSRRGRRKADRAAAGRVSPAAGWPVAVLGAAEAVFTTTAGLVRLICSLAVPLPMSGTSDMDKHIGFPAPESHRNGHRGLRTPSKQRTWSPARGDHPSIGYLAALSARGHALAQPERHHGSGQRLDATPLSGALDRDGLAGEGACAAGRHAARQSRPDPR